MSLFKKHREKASNLLFSSMFFYLFCFNKYFFLGGEGRRVLKYKKASNEVSLSNQMLISIFWRGGEYKYDKDIKWQ